LITDEAFALLVLENIWEGWIKMDPLQFFANKNTEKQKEKGKNNDLEGGAGLVNQQEHSDFVDGVWKE